MKGVPRLEVNVSYILHNAVYLSKLYSAKGISIMGVTKGVLGEPLIAEAMVSAGIKYLADSRIENIIKMQRANIKSKFVLLRTPLSQAQWVVENIEISLNTEIKTIERLSHFAKLEGVVHRVIIMVELGDLREGVLPKDISSFIKKVLKLENIEIFGIGCNLACWAGVRPDSKNMGRLSEITRDLEKMLSRKLSLVSGGNSANYKWYVSSANVGEINNLRFGESILLGQESLDLAHIPGLKRNAFKLFTEVIECKTKPSFPSGDIGRNAYGEISQFVDTGTHQRAIVALGRQDVCVPGLSAGEGYNIIGSSSDHIILEDVNKELEVGDEFEFNLDYSAMLSAMTSPFIKKLFIT